MFSSSRQIHVVFFVKQVDDITVIVAHMKPFPKYVEDDAESSDDSSDGFVPAPAELFVQSPKA
jgi:hypothetical protein